MSLYWELIFFVTEPLFKLFKLLRFNERTEMIACRERHEEL
jgi:hypothetical protein